MKSLDRDGIDAMACKDGNDDSLFPRTSSKCSLCNVFNDSMLELYGSMNACI